MKEKNSSDTGFSRSTQSSLITVLMGACMGVLVFLIGRKRDEPKETAASKYLQIDYLNEADKKQELYFTDLGGKVRKLVNYWKKKNK